MKLIIRILSSLLFVKTIISTANCHSTTENIMYHRYRLSSPQSPPQFTYACSHHRPSFGTEFPRSYNAGYRYHRFENSASVSSVNFAQRENTVSKNHNGYSSGIHGGLISAYFENAKHKQGSWGSPSSDSYPQHPIEVYSQNLFPCPKLEKALHRAKVNFNLAVDDKWQELTEMEATLFRQDLLTLCNVIRSNFHRASEKLRKSGQRSCGKQESFYEAVSVALEDIVAYSQSSEWYKRLRRFVGSMEFHHIINEIVSAEAK